MLRSLDVQQIFLQSDKTERIQQAHANSSECQQRHFESELAKERRALREKAKEIETADRLKVREKKSHEQQKRNRDKKRAGEEIDNAEKQSDDEPGSKIDIRV